MTKAWTSQTQSSVLWCSGILGSGKSVLMANIIEEVIATRRSNAVSICYFFCRYDDHRSLELRTIIGCITRQLLEQTGYRAAAGVETCIPSRPDIDEVKEILIQTTGTLQGSLILIVDGLDECDEETIRGFCEVAADLMGQSTSVKILISSRSDFVDFTRYKIETQHRIIMSESHNEMTEYIDNALEQLLESEELELSNPSLILSIRERLMDGAQGMSVSNHLNNI